MIENMRHSVIIFLLLMVGCGDHFSTQDAYAACESLLARVTTTTDEVFADCVACHEDCGSECEQGGSTPPTFTCP